MKQKKIKNLKQAKTRYANKKVVFKEKNTGTQLVGIATEVYTEEHTSPPKYMVTVGNVSGRGSNVYHLHVEDVHTLG